jgi:hypothetical protein
MCARVCVGVHHVSLQELYEDVDRAFEWEMFVSPPDLVELRVELRRASYMPSMPHSKKSPVPNFEHDKPVFKWTDIS